jgi:glycosyltransferase involved in cell wall biosynthesis
MLDLYAAAGSMRRKALLVANTSWYLYNFRRPLARALRDEGFDVVFVAPTDAYSARLTGEGFGFRTLRIDRRGTNPLVDLATLADLVALYTRERPDAVHHMTIKCVLYGSVAAALCQVPAVINAVTGLGHMFVSNTPRTTLLRPLIRRLYRAALASPRSRVIFQNEDDLSSFEQLGLSTREQAVLIRGSGVDTLRFSPRPDAAPQRPPMVLLVARLIGEKGIFEFLQAARMLRARGIAARFVVAGTPDPGNPSSIGEGQLARWRSEGVVDFLGHVVAIDELLARADVVVLPSYREGLPRTLLEAAAMGKAIVTTDVPGCRDAVQHEKNGLLVPVRDAAALSAAIGRLLDEPETRNRMGRAGRALVLREFDERMVVAQTLGVYRSLLDRPGQA